MGAVRYGLQCEAREASKGLAPQASGRPPRRPHPHPRPFLHRGGREKRRIAPHGSAAVSAPTNALMSSSVVVSVAATSMTSSMPASGARRL